MQIPHLLSLVTFLPLLGALFSLMVRGEEALVARNARFVALWASLGTFVVSLFIWFQFKRGSADFQFVEEVEWLPALGIGYRMGLDGISMPFVLLSTLL